MYHVISNFVSTKIGKVKSTLGIQKKEEIH
jgi:hypothetical protein